MAQSATSEDRGAMIDRVGIAVCAIAVFFVAMRFVTRGWLVRKFGWDDLLIGIALLVGTGETIALQLQIKHAYGQHNDKVAHDYLKKILVYKYVNMLLYYLANGAVKLSTLALYHRICSLQKGLPWFLRGSVVGTLAAVIMAFTLSTFLVEMFCCVPMSAIFDMGNPTRRCIAWVPFYLSQSAVDVVINLVLVLFPLPLLGILKIDKKQRYALVLIFSIGLLPLVASIIRMSQIAITVRTKASRSWEGRWIPLWSQIEVDVGIVAASLPSLSPLLRQLWSGFAQSQTMSPSHIPTLIEPGFNNRGGEAQGLQKLPSTISTLQNKSISTLGVFPNNSVSTLEEQDNAKRLTFFNDWEEREVDREGFPGPDGARQIGVARTLNTRLSRATFVDVPLSPRKSNGFPRVSLSDECLSDPQHSPLANRPVVFEVLGHDPLHPYPQDCLAHTAMACSRAVRSSSFMESNNW